MTFTTHSVQFIVRNFLFGKAMCFSVAKANKHPILELSRPLWFPADVYRRWYKLNFEP